MRPACWTAAVLLAACAHTETGPVEIPDGPPFGEGSWPRPITFNLYDDREPQWLPDGSGILYSTERGDRQYDKDRCVALLPRDGGTQQWRQCEVDEGHSDTTDTYQWPSMSPAGDAVFLHTTSWRLLSRGDNLSIAIAPRGDFRHSRLVRRLPFISDLGKTQVVGWTYRWLAPDRFVYLGVLQFFYGTTNPDTFYTGQEVTQVHLIDDTTVNFTSVPGTDWASSVAVGGDSTAIYYTIGGDSIVYRRHLNTGVVDTVHNFGWGRVVRDVSVRGTKLAAIVGDSVIFSFEPPQNAWVQRDEGGSLSVVDLTTGHETTFSLTPLWLFRHPEIDPTGTRLVVEAQPFAYPVRPNVFVSNPTNHRADLWLFALDEAPLGP